MNGCPDSDGDGVSDNVDNCADVAGPAANNGCPWPDSDSDGVLDKDDKCPNTAGLTAYNGCPVPTEEIMAQLNEVGAMIPFQLNKAELGSKVKDMLGDVLGVICLKKNPDQLNVFVANLFEMFLELKERLIKTKVLDSFLYSLTPSILFQSKTFRAKSDVCKRIFS